MKLSDHNYGPKSFNRSSDKDSLEMSLFYQLPLNSPTTFFYFSGPITVILRPAALATPENLIQMHILRIYPKNHWIRICRPGIQHSISISPPSDSDAAHSLRPLLLFRLQRNVYWAAILGIIPQSLNSNASLTY